MKKFIFTLAFLVLLLAGANQAAAAEKTVIYFFWGEGCPHCAEEKPFLEEMESKYPELEVKSFETWNNQENQKLFEEMAAGYGIEARGVPTTFIGDYEPIVGYADYMADDLEQKIVACLETGCVDPSVKARTTDGEEATRQSSEICLHFFYQQDCNQCQNVEGLLVDLEEEYNININRHDVEQEEELYQQFKETYGLAAGAHPIVFVGDRYLIGESGIKDYLEREIVLCQQDDCQCPAEQIRAYTPALPKKGEAEAEKDYQINVPLIGEVNISQMSLPVMTALIGFVDGFNPCSLWLITFLLGIVIHTGSRKKIILVGLTFLLVTSGIYALFMVGLLRVFTYIGYLTWIKIVVSLVALTFALVNIKDYFWYKKGISFTISDRFKPKIFSQIRNIMKRESDWGMIAGTVVLALGVALVELPCTAGFPVIWTSILAERNVVGGAFIGLLLIYILIYLLDELVVFAGIALTLEASAFEEKHGRALKLIGGMIMLSLAITLLAKPELMESISGTLIVFGTALGLSFLILLVHRTILPKFGIKIGSEEISSQDSQLEEKINKKA